MGNNPLKAARGPSAEASALVDAAITKHPVVIFSKTSCPYCHSAKSAIASAGASVAAFAPPKVYELDRMGALGSAVQAYLAQKTGRRTVPNVFIGAVPVGGGDDVAGYARRNVLKQMLTQAPDRIAALAPSPQANQPAPPSPPDIVEQAIKEHPVVVFSKSYCPYCVSAKRDIATAQRDIPQFAGPKVFELNHMGKTGSQIQTYLAQKTGRRTVPNVFIAGVPVGGGDEIAALAAKDKLVPLIRAAIQPVPTSEGAGSSENPAEKLVEEAIAASPVVVFSKSYCPYCTNAKSNLQQAGADVDGYQPAKVFELDTMGGMGEDVQQYLAEKTGQRTVPSIFIGGKHLGGNDDLSGYIARGELKQLLVQAGSDGAMPVLSENPAEKLVEEAIAASPVVVFSKSYCPYCTNAKSNLQQAGADVDGYQPAKVFELDTMGGMGEDVQQYLAEKTGQRTVPSIFIGGKHLGGNDDLSGYIARGELKQLLVQAGSDGAMPVLSENPAEKLVEEAIAASPVVVFSKSYCPYCTNAKSNLQQAGADVDGYQPAKVFELDTMGGMGEDVQQYLAEKTGQRTVPSIFIGGKHLGGNDDLSGYIARGELKQLLVQAGSDGAMPVLSENPAEKLVEEAIAASPVVVFSKSYCPYCTNAKSNLQQAGADVDGYQPAKVFELDTMGGMGEDVQQYLAEKTGQRTVPSIFIGGKHLGGNDDLSGYIARGELKQLLVQAGSDGAMPVLSENPAEKLVEEAIAASPVVVFSKSYCPYCTNAKSNLQQAGADVDGYQPAKVFELDTMGGIGDDVQRYLAEKTGQRTVPSIFIGGKHLGGNDDLSGYIARGELKQLLVQAGSDGAMPVLSENPAEKLVEEAIAASPVVVFSKSYCPYCTNAKSNLQQAGADVDGYQPAKVFELDTMGGMGEDVQQYLAEKTGQRTVPSIFIGGKHLGGNDDLSGYIARGELKQLLVDATTPFAQEVAASAPTPASPATKEIVFGAGCFWGVELAFQRVVGVLRTEVGYTNGQLPRVTYEAVCSGRTGSAEVVRVTYDPVVVSLAELLKLWEARHDPTSMNKQGNDVGTQYRSGVYYNDDEQKAEIEKWRDEASTRLSKPIVSEIAPLNNYCPAEHYHQQYLEKKGQSAEKGERSHIRCYG